MANSALNENFNENQVKCLDQIVAELETVAGTEATTTVAGVVLQGAAVADGAVPFASLTTAANKVNELLASLRAAGVIAT